MHECSSSIQALSLVILTASHTLCSAENPATISSLDTTVVYADKIHKEWLHTEGSSMSYSPDFLTKLGIRNEHDFISMAGGYLGNPTSGQFSLRGLNSDNLLGYIGTRSNSVITTLSNGVPLSASTTRYFPQSIWGLQSASILKGGQSSTYGPNALGGIVSYHSSLPQMNNTGGIQAEFSTNDTFRAEIHQNLKISDQAAIRLEYQRLASDGFIENVTSGADDWEKTDSNTFGAQFLWQSEDLNSELHASLTFDRSQSNPFGAVRSFGSYSENDRKTDENTRTLYPADHWLGSVNFSHLTDSGLQISNTLGISTLNVNSLIDLDGSAFLPWFVQGNIDETHFSNDFSIRGELDEHLWLVGAYSQKSEYDVGFRGSGLIGPGIPFISLAEEDVLINAIYGKFDYQFDSQWSVIAGLRINHEERELNTHSETALSPLRISDSKTSYTDLLPSLTLAWSPDEKATTGVKLSRNYRGGGVSYAPTLGLTQKYAPEYSNDIEWYFKATPSDTLQWSASLFYSELEDIQVPISVPMGIPNIDVLIDNSGKGRKYGAELQGTWEAQQNVFLDLNATYVNTEFSSLDIAGVDYSDSDFPNAPEFVGSFGIAYLPESGFYASSHYSWSSSSFTQINSQNLTKLRQRSNLSARVGFKKEQFDFYLFANNLMNKDYALGRIDASGLGLGVLAKMNTPRTFGAGFSTSW